MTSWRSCSRARSSGASTSGFRARWTSASSGACQCRPEHGREGEEQTKIRLSPSVPRLDDLPARSPPDPRREDHPRFPPTRPPTPRRARGRRPRRAVGGRRDEIAGGLGFARQSGQVDGEDGRCSRSRNWHGSMLRATQNCCGGSKRRWRRRRRPWRRDGRRRRRGRRWECEEFVNLTKVPSKKGNCRPGRLFTVKSPSRRGEDCPLGRRTWKLPTVGNCRFVARRQSDSGVFAGIVVGGDFTRIPQPVGIQRVMAAARGCRRSSLPVCWPRISDWKLDRSIVAWVVWKEGKK